VCEYVGGGVCEWWWIAPPMIPPNSLTPALKGPHTPTHPHTHTPTRSPHSPMNPSVIDIARHCKVSPSTVCRALNARRDINAATRQRILTACDKLGYVKDTGASNLRLRCSQVIACLMPDQTNELFIEKLYFIKQAVLTAGYHWRLYSFQDQAEATVLLREILSARPRGLILGLSLDRGLRNLLRGTRVPAVCYDCRTPGVDAVTLDRQQGAYEAARHMLSKGRRRILLLGSAPDSDRGRGYVKAITEAGLSVNHGLVVATPFGKNLFEYGYTLVKALLGGTAFDGILAVNDACAIGAIRALKEAGRQVPRHVSVIGFDNIMVTPFTTPALTTISQPKEEMAARCVELLLRRLADPNAARRNVRLKTALCVRESA